MTGAEFHNALRILSSIDRHDLVQAGVIESDDFTSWETFRTNPYGWALRANDNSYDKLWDLICSRQPKAHEDSVDGLEAFYGTFGLGHEYHDRYVLIYAKDEAAAREVMITAHGQRWSSLYGTYDGARIVEKYGYELMAIIKSPQKVSE